MLNDNGKKAILALADGTVYQGRGYGPLGVYEGEAVFATGMVGYPESMTDPSYHKQFLAFTYPLIGNYGVHDFVDGGFGIPKYFESDSIKTAGIITHEICDRPNHWTNTKTLEKWLDDEGVPAISGIDTRSLTKRLREYGTMSSCICICDGSTDIDRLLDKARKMKDPTDDNLVREASTEFTRIYNDNAKDTVVLLDCGAKYGIVRSLVNRGMRVVQVKYDTPYDVIEGYSPKGLMISNGPGNPDKVDSIRDTINDAISSELPVFGICMGNQLLALARGASTYKLPYGHRSQNQPCVEMGTKRCYITSQNHGYVVDPDSLEDTDMELWFVNANDDSCEGLRSDRVGAFSVQFHPEASPGPEDTNYLFDIFMKAMGI
ncbi:MAG TPA: glutamine-hydrolyzing carbamoyl-phosphate synthase small subunit [Candidatus Methanofastidiosa archaeon]|nr:glutamine-hydrolyzing carbamoyl-phosphate synthase small subunit [Candidatus Methanofastidiosa archaeon]HPR41194.1 glutamine-hydrolyzing carbamoyl-phosphate synthase small subunit [Candidatus Methanofastidiosa archaeon]